MSNEKHYPLHPNQSHPPIMTCEIPLEEYESLKRENAELKAKVDELSFDQKLLESHWESEKNRCEAASRDCIELSNENAKLVSKIESLKVGHRQGIASLKSYYKAKLESVQASMYADVVDAGMKNRRLRRLLWHAIALFCARSCAYFNGIMSHCLIGQDDLYKRCEEKKNKYLNAMYKFRAKAKEFE